MRKCSTSIDEGKAWVASEPKRFNRDDYLSGRDKAMRREAEELSDWEREYQQYARQHRLVLDAGRQEDRIMLSIETGLRNLSLPALALAVMLAAPPAARHAW